MSKIDVAGHEVGVAEAKVGGAAAPPTEWEIPPVLHVPGRSPGEQLRSVIESEVRVTPS